MGGRWFINRQPRFRTYLESDSHMNKSQMITSAAAWAALALSGAIAWLNNQETDRQVLLAASYGQAFDALASGIESLAAEQVIELPEDGRTWSTVFVWPVDKERDPVSRQLAAVWASDARLQSLAAQTKVYHYDTSSPLWRERYAAAMGGQLPQVWVLRPDENNASSAQAVYKASGANIPLDGSQLANEIAQRIEDCCPRPRPRPEPDPAPGPAVEPIPDLRPQLPADDPEDMSWLVYLLPIVAAGVGGLIALRRE